MVHRGPPRDFEEPSGKKCCHTRGKLNARRTPSMEYLEVFGSTKPCSRRRGQMFVGLKVGLKAFANMCLRASVQPMFLATDWDAHGKPVNFHVQVRRSAAPRKLAPLPTQKDRWCHGSPNMLENAAIMFVLFHSITLVSFSHTEKAIGGRSSCVRLAGIVSGVSDTVCPRALRMIMITPGCGARVVMHHCPSVVDWTWICDRSGNERMLQTQLTVSLSRGNQFVCPYPAP